MRPFAAFALTTLALCAPALHGAPAKKPVARPKPTAPPGPARISQLQMKSPLAAVNGTPLAIGEYVDRLSLKYGPDILDQMLSDTLIRQEAKRLKITATAAEVKAAVARLYDDAARRAGGEDRLIANLQRRFWTTVDFRNVMRPDAETIVLQEKIAVALGKSIKIPDADIQSVYENQKHLYDVPDQVQISHIMIRRPTGEDAAEDLKARKKAELLLEKVREAKGANFAEVAREASEDKESAGRGGALNAMIRKGQNPLGAEFDALAYSGPLGLIDVAIKSPIGYHIVRVDKRTPGKVIPLAEVKDQLKAQLLTIRKQERLTERMAELRAQAKIQLHHKF